MTISTILSEKPLFGIIEAARLLGFNPETLRRMIREGRLPAQRFAGGSYRIRAEVLAQMLGLDVASSQGGRS